MSKTTLIWAGVAVIVVAIGAYVFMNPNMQPGTVESADTEGSVMGGQDAPSPETVPSGLSTTIDVDAGTNPVPMTATITYNGTSYSPSTVKIMKGGTVTWENTSSGSMWVASDNHPSHTMYDGSSRQQHCASPSFNTFDQCKGESSDYSFTFTKAGTWGFHDHINASASGSVTVVE